MTSTVPPHHNQADTECKSKYCSHLKFLYANTPTTTPTTPNKARTLIHDPISNKPKNTTSCNAVGLISTAIAITIPVEIASLRICVASSCLLIQFNILIPNSKATTNQNIKAKSVLLSTNTKKAHIPLVNRNKNKATAIPTTMFLVVIVLCSLATRWNACCANNTNTIPTSGHVRKFICTAIVSGFINQENGFAQENQ